MGNFLLVIPEGWTQLDWQNVSTNVDGINSGSVPEWINANYYVDMEEKLKAAGFIPADKSLIEAKLIDDSYFMVRLG